MVLGWSCKNLTEFPAFDQSKDPHQELIPAQQGHLLGNLHHLLQQNITQCLELL